MVQVLQIAVDDVKDDVVCLFCGMIVVMSFFFLCFRPRVFVLWHDSYAQDGSGLGLIV